MNTQFEQFIKKASQSPEDVQIIQSSNKYLNYQTKLAIVASKKRMKLASNFIKMGITATLISIPLLASAGLELATSKYQDEMRDVIKISQEKGYLKSNINLSIKEALTDSRYNRLTESENHSNIIDKEKCDVTITLSSKGDTVFMADSENLKAITANQNEEQKKISRHFLLLHEASHCEFSKTKDVFLIKDNPQLQKEVNYYLKHAWGTDQIDSPYSLLNENFADTYAAVQILKIYGATSDVKKVLNNMLLERQDMDLSYSVGGKVDSHYTHFSLAELLKKENMEDIKNTSKPEELKTLALKISNQGTNTVLATYSDILPGLFEQQTMIDSTLINANNNSISAFIASNTLKINLEAVQTSSTLSFFEQLGNEVLLKNPIPRSYNTSKAVVSWTESQIKQMTELSSSVFKNRYENEWEKIEDVSNKFINYVKTTTTPDLNEKTDVSTTFAELEIKKLKIIKEHQERSIELDSIGGFFNKIKSLQNIQNIRGDMSSSKKLTPN